MCVCVKTHYTTVCLQYGCRKKKRKKAQKGNTPVTITEPKKMTEWLSVGTKVYMMDLFGSS